jgi:hypothetical protein
MTLKVKKKMNHVAFVLSGLLSLIFFSHTRGRKLHFTRNYSYCTWKKKIQKKENPLASALASALSAFRLDSLIARFVWSISNRTIYPPTQDKPDTSEKHVLQVQVTGFITFIGCNTKHHRSAMNPSSKSVLSCCLLLISRRRQESKANEFECTDPQTSSISL